MLILLTASQYNAANELILVTPPSGPPTTSTWDANGNLALQNAGGALTTYGWDPENRLLSVGDNTGNENYAYSADGLRQKKVTGAGTTNFVWDESNVLQERDAGLAKTAQYTDWPGFWGGLVSQRRSGTSSFYGFDSQGSTRVLVSVAGLVTDSYSYKAFGEELATGSGTVNAHRFVGLMGYYRDSAGRQYVGARELDVASGRWLSRDPAWSEVNEYLYCDNCAIVGMDPSGLQWPVTPPQIGPVGPPPSSIIGRPPVFRTPPGIRLPSPSIGNPITRPIVVARPSPNPGALPRWCRVGLTGGLIIWFVCEASPCGPTSEFGPEDAREREIRRQHCIDQLDPCTSRCDQLATTVGRAFRSRYRGSPDDVVRRWIQRYKDCCHAWCSWQLGRCLSAANHNQPPPGPTEFDCSPLGMGRHRPNPFI